MNTSTIVHKHLSHKYFEKLLLRFKKVLHFICAHCQHKMCHHCGRWKTTPLFTSNLALYVTYTQEFLTQRTQKYSQKTWISQNSAGSCSTQNKESLYSSSACLYRVGHYSAPRSRFLFIWRYISLHWTWR